MRKQWPWMLAAAALSVPWTLLVVWRWNHEMVRIYDFPPISFWIAFPVMLAISLGMMAVYVLGVRR
jgi:hypothetical protein